MRTLVNEMEVYELTNEELQDIDGGLGPLLVFGALAIGSMVIGAGVGYGVACLIDRVTR